MANVNLFSDIYDSDREEFLRILTTISQKKLDELSFKSLEDSSNSELLKLLIVKRFLNNPQNIKGQSLLHYAVICNNQPAVNILLENRYNPNEVDDEDRTPLHFAVMNGINPQIIKDLLEYNADINAITERLETPLFLACTFGNKEAIEILLSRKDCNALYPNDLGQEPIYIAYKNNNKDIINLLYNFIKENNPQKS
jgi:ankyrin repeat protein